MFFIWRSFGIGCMGLCFWGRVGRCNGVVLVFKKIEIIDVSFDEVGDECFFCGFDFFIEF